MPHAYPLSQAPRVPDLNSLPASGSIGQGVVRNVLYLRRAGSPWQAVGAKGGIKTIPPSQFVNGGSPTPTAWIISTAADAPIAGARAR